MISLLVMQQIMVVTVVLMVLIGAFFFVKYYFDKKKLDHKNVDRMRSHRLDLMLSILLLAGGVFISLFIPFVG